MSITVADDRAGAEDLGFFDRLARRAVLHRLKDFKDGELTLEEHGKKHVFGEVRPEYPIRAKIRIHSPRVWRAVVRGGTIGAAESYVDGDWTSDDPVAVTRIFVRNRRAMESLEGGTAKLKAAFDRVRHFFRRNTPTGSRSNISAHYDAGNDFYELFLDETMAYSSAVFAHEDEPLVDASRRKFEVVCRKLALGRDDHLLEVGTGWGGLAIWAAKHFGCRVTTTTISKKQFEYAQAAIRREGLEDRITLLCDDYRALRGRFSKIVSIEMIEAVGHDFLERYMRAFRELLEPCGLALIQAIVIAEEYFELAKRSVDFIQRYIFPGSAIPSIGSIMRAVASVGGLRLVRFDDIGHDYALTLRHWRRRFMENADRIRALGRTDADIRLWEYYFAYCEGGFLERSISDVHLLFAPSERPTGLVAASAKT